MGSTTTIFVTDADNREVLEYDGTSGQVARWYAYGLGPNDVLGQQNLAAGTRTTLIPDIQGSFIGALDSGGTLTKFGYLPYGRANGTPSTFGYTGQRFDAAENTGLYYYRARMYMPAWGRFLQPDPVSSDGGSNLYKYGTNDPLNTTDPLGLWTLQVGFTLAALLPWGLTGSVSAGLVVDLHGNAGYYGSVGAGPGVGGYVKAGASGAVSSANTIFDLQSSVSTNGLSTVISPTAGAGVGGSIDRGKGAGLNGETYTSLGATIGLATGAGVGIQYQWTQIITAVQWTTPSGQPIVQSTASPSNQPSVAQSSAGVSPQQQFASQPQPQPQSQDFYSDAFAQGVPQQQFSQPSAPQSSGK